MIVRASQSALDEVRKRRSLLDKCDSFLFSEVAPYIGRRVIEVGCGYGNLVAHMLDRELVVATDVDPTSIDQTGRRFGHQPNVVPLLCDIAGDDVSCLQQYNCDTVICLNTLEHISEDEKALMNMSSIVHVGGYVVIIVPAFQFLYGTMDASIGHYRRYTRQGMKAKLQAVGLQVKRQYYVNVLGIAGWFVNGRILRKEVPPESQLRLFNLLYPITSRVEAVLPRVMGLSLVSISYRAGRVADL